MDNRILLNSGGIKALELGTKVLFAVCLILALYIAKTLIFEKDITLRYDPSVTSSTTRESLSAEAEQISKNFEDYKAVIEKKVIFKLPYESSRKNAEEISDSPAGSPSIEIDVARDFKLVGIVLDNDPKAIIENKKSSETLFFSLGQDINGVVLEEIDSGKAVFRHNNKTVEINP